MMFFMRFLYLFIKVKFSLKITYAVLKNLLVSILDTFSKTLLRKRYKQQLYCTVNYFNKVSKKNYVHHSTSLLL